MFNEKDIYFVEVLINGKTERAKMAFVKGLSQDRIKELVEKYFQHNNRDNKFLNVEIWRIEKESYPIIVCG